MDADQTSLFINYNLEAKLTPLIHANPWTFPLDAFYDLYDNLDRLLLAETHTHLEGRQGAGKTALMVKAYRTIHEKFLDDEKVSPPFNTIAVFIDLKKDDVDVPMDISPQKRASVIYNRILDLLLTAQNRAEDRRDRRFWGLEDYINEQPRWLRRQWTKWRHLRSYRKYLYRQDKVIISRNFQEKVSYGNALGGTAQIGIETEAHYDASATRATLQEVALSGEFTLFSGKVRYYLEQLLDAMQVDNLLIFLDEWSSTKIGVDTQPYLYQLLTQTFPPGGRVSLKIATITGLTRFTKDRETPYIDYISLDHIVAIRSSWMRNRLTTMLLQNLAVVSKGQFPSKYLSPEEQNQNYPQFRKTFFADENAYLEFLSASEALPRQALLLFIALYRSCKRLALKQIITPIVKQEASFYFSNKHQLIQKDVSQASVFDEILRKSSRIVDIELAPSLRDVINNFLEEGILFRCEGGAHQQYERYYLSYPAEAYRQHRYYTGPKQGHLQFEEIEIQPADNCHCFQDLPRIHLVEVAEMLKKSKEVQTK